MLLRSQDPGPGRPGQAVTGTGREGTIPAQIGPTSSSRWGLGSPILRLSLGPGLLRPIIAGQVGGSSSRGSLPFPQEAVCEAVGSRAAGGTQALIGQS